MTSSADQTQHFETLKVASQNASHAFAAELRRLIESHGRAVALFDCVGRHAEFFDQLVIEPGVDWTQVIVFQSSEQLGERADSESSCQKFLTEQLLKRVPIVSFHPLRGDAPNPRAAATNFGERLTKTPPDLALLSTEVLAVLPPHSSEQVVGVNLATNRQLLSISLEVLLACPAVFVLGIDTSTKSSFIHRNTHSFLSKP